MDYSPLYEAFNTVLTDKSQKDGYAKAYADAGLSMSDPEELRVQTLYVLSNLQYWRGDTAKATKAVLKQFSKK